MIFVVETFCRNKYQRQNICTGGSSLLLFVENSRMTNPWKSFKELFNHLNDNIDCTPTMLSAAINAFWPHDVAIYVFRVIHLQTLTELRSLWSSSGSGRSRNSVCIRLGIYLYTRESRWNSLYNTINPDRPQHDRPAPCAIAQQYSSATFVSWPFHPGRRAFQIYYIPVYFVLLNCVSLKVRSLDIPSVSLYWILTYSMVQSPSWEANWFAVSQEIPRIIWNPEVHYRTHKRPPTVPILGQPNPVHIPTSHLLEINFNIIHPSTPRSPHWSLSLRFPHQDPTHLTLLTHTCHMPSPSHSSRFYHPHYIGWGVQIM